MNKAFFILTATLALSLASSARATGLDGLFSVTPGAEEESTASQMKESPETKRTPRIGASAQANCRHIDVELDEGYGVSSHETRYVCEPIP